MPCHSPSGHEDLISTRPEEQGYPHKTTEIAGQDEPKTGSQTPPLNFFEVVLSFPPPMWSSSITTLRDLDFAFTIPTTEIGVLRENLK